MLTGTTCIRRCCEAPSRALSPCSPAQAATQTFRFAGTAMVFPCAGRDPDSSLLERCARLDPCLRRGTENPVLQHPICGLESPMGSPSFATRQTANLTKLTPPALSRAYARALGNELGE